MKNSIIWYGKPNKSRTPFIIFNASGQFSFNTSAKQFLPDYVKIGFEPQEKLLYIKSEGRKDGLRVSTPSLSLKDLTVRMSKSGIQFPVKFEISPIEDTPEEWKASANYFDEESLIKTIHSIKDIKAARSCTEMEQLLLLYDTEIRKICRSYSRTIPKSDRFQLASEAFVNAVFTYKPYLEVFKEHISSEIRKFLSSQISDYSGSYQEYYPLQRTSPDGSEYEVYSSAAAEQAFNQMIDTVDLSRTLTPLEADVYRLISEGYIRKEFCQRLNSGYSISYLNNHLSSARHRH